MSVSIKLYSPNGRFLVQGTSGYLSSLQRRVIKLIQVNFTETNSKVSANASNMRHQKVEDQA